MFKSHYMWYTVVDFSAFLCYGTLFPPLNIKKTLKKLIPTFYLTMWTLFFTVLTLFLYKHKIARNKLAILRKKVWITRYKIRILTFSLTIPEFTYHNSVIEFLSHKCISHNSVFWELWVNIRSFFRICFQEKKVRIVRNKSELWEKKSELCNINS